ncbi:YlxR family protein [Amycolatopsis antarctica]|uniref:YlxR family protein n=1 Tax=Amycolatopsis antarctica TaxID=1854586 RepID=UPI003B839829
MRTCVGCRRRAVAGELLRVVAVNGHLVVDVRRRLPGRGAWLHPVPECLVKAERRRAFPRALRVPGVLGVDALGEVRQYLEHHLERLTEHSQDAGAARIQSESRKQVDPS